MTPDKETEGEFAGWKTWKNMDPYEGAAGPFYYKRGDDGEPIAAFRAEKRHMNGFGALHGGCLASFADFAAFCIAGPTVETGAVTASLNIDFLDAAREGDLVTCTGDTPRAGKSLVFTRGIIRAGDKTVGSFSAVLKRVGG
ncbi:PaaI family thioesterase [Euryhalocaulis caribicus]|uniref:PaaI family thioesterase n=1 Tax=Euryhalocaulis caribicus TaxID=1161401 RepID=UPI0003A86C27|nr:PaaI family thioesterase [Euryhalocaulis caribicus]